jgi:hypothetical protein
MEMTFLYERLGQDTPPAKEHGHGALHSSNTRPRLELSMIVSREPRAQRVCDLAFNVDVVCHI